ncbi:ATP-binding protein [Streptosporangium sandarakinum]
MSPLSETTARGSTVEDRLALLQATYVQLLAAARACVAAERLGEADPVGYVRELLADNGQLPPVGARPSHLLADTSATGDNPVYERSFAGCAESVPQVRRFVTALLRGCPRAEDAALCASELASNALLHTRSGRAGGRFVVRLQVCGQVCVRITVDDQGVDDGQDEQPGETGTRDPALTRPAGEGGYGLAVVRALAGGGPGLTWRRTPAGGVASCMLAWPAQVTEVSA